MVAACVDGARKGPWQYRSATYRELQARLGANVRRLRERMGWTQEECRHRAKMAPQLLQRVELGRTNTTLTTLARLCAGLGVDPRRLLASTTKTPAQGRGRQVVSQRR